MISENTEITTRELCELVDLTKGRISHLQSAGVIKPVGRDCWRLIETVRALVNEARERTRIAASPERARWEAARAQREEMKAKQLVGELCRTKDFDDAWVEVIGYMVAGITAIPARCTRDRVLRRTIEAQLDAWRVDVANYFQRRADELEGKGGKAA